LISSCFIQFRDRKLAMDDKISPTTNGIRCGLNADDDQPNQTPHDPT
jgi:hypothetical protein